MPMRRLLVVVLLAAAACGGDPPPGRTYYQRNIEPILVQSCAGNTSGCHATNPDDPSQVAAGNFDVTSFDNVQKRRDLLRPFGPYQVPLLLVKSVAPGELDLAYRDRFLDVDVLHVGGPILQVGSDAYLTLLSWTENGATANGLLPPSPPRPGTGPCTPDVPAGFDPAPFTGHPQFPEFSTVIMPILSGCNSGSCHGAPQSDFFLTCGVNETQLAFNFAQTWAFVDDPVDESQFLRVPLARGAGGGPHTGGDQLTSRDDAAYRLLENFAAAVGPRTYGVGDAGRTFFADHVQPMLLTRGCAFEACHSPGASNDLKLRSGSQGFFSPVSLERNYHVLKHEFMAMELPDVRRGRAVAKTILDVDGGIAHRGGPVMGAGDASVCGPFDPQAEDPRPICVMQEWLRIERAAMIARGEIDPLGAGSTVPLVFVDRAATHVADPLQFDTYQPGSDLRVADVDLGANGRITGAGASVSLLGGCGVTTATADVRGPDVRHDGVTIAFAMRTSASDPLGIWTVNVDGTNCQRITPAEPDRNGLELHHFDPAWSPDGESIVYASTRGSDAVGPTVSRKRFLPQSDLWRMRRDGSMREQLTYLTGSELNPQMMREGRITMTTEKVSGDLYQLAGRRMNWDSTDYHPLLAQRAVSKYADPADPAATRPSVGYAQATDIREDRNGNFLAIFSDVGARGGAGALAVFNRSIGPFEVGRRATDPGFLESVRMVDPAATGRVGSATQGAYRNPTGSTDGRIIVSYAAFSGDLGTATSLDWDVVVIDPVTAQRTVLAGGAGAQVDAVLAIKQPAHAPYFNRRQLVFGGRADRDATGGRAILHFPDAPMVFTLLTGNLRRGRPVDDFRRARQLAVYAEAPAPAGTTSGSGPGGIFEQRTLLGRARLADADGSTKISVPAGVPVVLELQDDAGNPIVNVGEEYQAFAGEMTNIGVSEDFFDSVCGGCHGSVTGSELDVTLTPDALTGASESASADDTPQRIGP